MEIPVANSVNKINAKHKVALRKLPTDNLLLPFRNINFVTVIVDVVLAATGACVDDVSTTVVLRRWRIVLCTGAVGSSVWVGILLGGIVVVVSSV